MTCFTLYEYRSLLSSAISSSLMLNKRSSIMNLQQLSFFNASLPPLYICAQTHMQLPPPSHSVSFSLPVSFSMTTVSTE